MPIDTSLLDPLNDVQEYRDLWPLLSRPVMPSLIPNSTGF